MSELRDPGILPDSSPCLVTSTVTEQTSALPDAPRLSYSNNTVPVHCTWSSLGTALHAWVALF